MKGIKGSITSASKGERSLNEWHEKMQLNTRRRKRSGRKRNIKYEVKGEVKGVGMKGM